MGYMCILLFIYSFILFIIYLFNIFLSILAFCWSRGISLNRLINNIFSVGTEL